MYLKKSLITCALLLWCGTAWPDELNFDTEDDFFFNLGSGPVRQNCSNADQIVPPLFECKILDILKNNIFLRTNDLNSRSLLDMPLFQTPLPKNDDLTINLNVFFNKTDRCNFTSNSDRIDSYLALQDCALLQSIETAFETIKTSECGDFLISAGIPRSIFDTDVRRLFGLFANATIEQRRAGALADIYKSKNNWTVGLKLPIYWVERNLFITQSEQDALMQAGLLTEQAPNDALQFQSDHLISDEVGIGDTRLFAAYQFLNKNDSTIDLGVFVTMPTALAVQKGVVGSEFRNCLPVPSLDLCAILNSGLNPDTIARRALQDLAIFGEEFVDRLSAMLSDSELGNKGHWGFGLFLEPSVTFNPKLTWRTRLSFEQLLPATEQRFFIKKFDEAAWDAHDFASSDETIAEENLRAINQRILDMFFPTPCSVTVLPGQIAYFTNYFTYSPTKKVDVMFGIDYWYQAQEDFHIPLGSQLPLNFEVNIARNPSAQQFKILGGIAYKSGTPDNGWILSLNGDKTVFSTGIGKDYTFNISIQRTW